MDEYKPHTIDPTPTNELTHRAGEIATEGLEQAQRLGATARERLIRGADERKGKLASGLDHLAQRIENMADDREGGGESELPRDLVERAARGVRSLSRTLSERSTEDLLAAARQKMRERPGWVLAGCLALGFVGARMLRK